ncbi:MAG: GDSL-type esterase/lipase family protein [Lachnospiraceae bacterium]|nr:GDSL-type esterase/lipase family protein [Lachnospiraceae bacterium]
MKRVNLNAEELSYTGRIDWTDSQKPEFIFPATSMNFRFYGKRAVITVENRKVCYDNYAGVIVDGVQSSHLLNDGGETRIVLVDEQEDKEHDILFFKRQDGCHVMALLELELSDGSRLLQAPEKPQRRIEVYGDSVSAGEVSEAVAYRKKADPEHSGEFSNSWYSYAWIAARKLHASLHNVSQGGIPLLNGNGWVAPPYYPGMEFMWDKLHYHPQLGRVSEWDFSRYTPQLVIVAIGQNDSNPDDYMKLDPDGVRGVYWRYKYGCLIREIRKKYPRAVILLTTTILEHDAAWDRAIEEVCRELKDDRVRHFLYRENGCGTPGHVRIPEAEQMAAELAEYVERLDIPVWEESV